MQIEITKTVCLTFKNADVIDGWLNLDKLISLNKLKTCVRKMFLIKSAYTINFNENAQILKIELSLVFKFNAKS